MRQPETKFERMQRQQKFGKTQQNYEQFAHQAVGILFGLWTILWIGMALTIPSGALWMVVIWLVGCGALSGALVKVQMTKRQSAKYLSVAKPLEELYRMNPLDFEHAVALRMRLLGYQNVQVTPAMGDGGIDILMEKDGLRYGVQCKKYHPESFVKIDEIRAFVYAYRKAGCDKGIYVTTAQYSDFARREMAQEGVTLVDGRALVQIEKGIV